MNSRLFYSRHSFDHLLSWLCEHKLQRWILQAFQPDVLTLLMLSWTIIRLFAISSAFVYNRREEDKSYLHSLNLHHVETFEISNNKLRSELSGDAQSERIVAALEQRQCKAHGDSARSGKLDRARSRLYRSQILQENMRWKALAEIYKMHSFAQLCNLNFLSNLPKMLQIFWKFSQILANSSNFSKNMWFKSCAKECIL